MHAQAANGTDDFSSSNGRQSQPPEAAVALLELALDALALPGGDAAGAELLGGLLAAGGLANYFSAALAAVLACTQPPSLEAGLRLLTQQPAERLPLAVLVEAVSQVPAGFFMP